VLTLPAPHVRWPPTTRAPSIPTAVRWSPTYGQEGDPPSRQLELRWWVLPGKLQIDGTLGARDGNTPRRWTSVGLRALF